jgi:hypothetical protein
MTYGDLIFPNISVSGGGSTVSHGFINLAVGKIYSIEVLIHGQQNNGQFFQFTLNPVVHQVGTGTAPIMLFDYVRGDAVSRSDPAQFEEDIHARGVIDNSAGTTDLKVAFQVSIDQGSSGNPYVVTGSYFVEEVGTAAKQSLS